MNYIEYVRKLRIKKAKELLKRTNKTIEEISNEVGWESAKRFRDVFKEFEGISPNEYRKNGEKD